MKLDSRLAARVALFSALAYVAALITVYIPNVSLSFIVIFAAGVLFGLKAGLMVGALGEFLWTVFNPLGMASLPITLAQITGMALVGVLGAAVRQSSLLDKAVGQGFWLFALLGLTAGLIYQLILNLVGAWLFQPFWPSLLAGLAFSLATVVSNGFIFALAYPFLVKLVARERKNWY